MTFSAILQKLLRRKYIDVAHVTDTQLSRCLNTLDLTALGIGSTLGAGIYVVAGQVALDKAGPSVVLSFFIAALASVMAGLCYAEFGARVPKTGSAYVYSYVTVGELWAFIIGWNLILEYAIGTASVARAWSTYFDSLLDKRIETFFNDTMHMPVSFLSEYPDFFAFGITILLAVILAVGVKESSFFNNIFTGLNLLVVSFVVISGIFKADGKNWAISESEAKQNHAGVGGFFPFGFSGMMSGAATCFYAFVGFDVIATTGEEVRNPQRAIPISIILALTFCFFAYFGVSAIITLMVPYYSLDRGAPLPQVFDDVGWSFARYVIAIGAICGLSTSLLGAMFPLPRVIYAMASDGLVFRILSKISERFKTPFLATIVSGIFTGMFAMLFDLGELVDMMSIGTLMAYTIVAACVLILRYRRVPFEGDMDITELSGVAEYTENSVGENRDEEGESSTADVSNVKVTKQPTFYEVLQRHSLKAVAYQLLQPLISKERPPPSDLSSTLVSIIVLIMACFIALFAGFSILAVNFDSNLLGLFLTLAILFGLLVVICTLVIFLQPQNTHFVTFKVPLVPFIPALSMVINIYLMLKLSGATWIRFAIWMVFGFIIYFGYGIWESSEEVRENTSLLDPTADRPSNYSSAVHPDTETESKRDAED